METSDSKVVVTEGWLRMSGGEGGVKTIGSADGDMSEWVEWKVELETIGPGSDYGSGPRTCPRDVGCAANWFRPCRPDRGGVEPYQMDVFGNARGRAEC